MRVFRNPMLQISTAEGETSSTAGTWLFPQYFIWCHFWYKYKHQHNIDYCCFFKDKYDGF